MTGIPLPPSYTGPGSEKDKRQQPFSADAIPLPPSMSQPETPSGPPGFFGSLANIGKSIAHLSGFGDPDDVAKTRQIVTDNLFNQGKADASAAALLTKLSTMFGNASWKSTDDKLSAMARQTDADPIGAAKGMATAFTGLPLGVLSMIANPVKVVTGLDITADDPAGFTAEQQADQIKELLGTGAGFLVSAGTSKAIEAASLASNASEFGITSKAAKSAIAVNEAGTSAAQEFVGTKTKDLVKGGLAEPQLGQMGRNILEHAAGGASFGIAQTAFTHSGDDDVVAQMILAGVSFAPLGAATGLLQSAMGAARGVAPEVGAPERLKAAALDVALTRQVSATLDKSLDEIIAGATSVAQSDNMLEAVIRGKIKTNPKAFTIFRGVDVTKIPDKAEGLTIHTFMRPDGKADVVAYPTDNTLFEGREVANNPVGKIERAKDSNGNLIAQVGDPMIKVTKNGDILHGVLALRNGEMWVRPIEVEQSGPDGFDTAKSVTGDVNPVKSPPPDLDPVKVKAVKWLMDKRGGQISLSAIAEQLGIDFKDAKPYYNYLMDKPTEATHTVGTQSNYSKFDPVEWYVNPDRIESGVDFDMKKADKATANERSTIGKVFQATGKLPPIAKIISGYREVAGYLGQEFFVKEINGDKAVLDIPNKLDKKGKVKPGTSIEVPVGDIQMRDPAVIQPDAPTYYDRIFKKEFDPKILDQPDAQPFVAWVAKVASDYGLANDQLRSLRIEMANRMAEHLKQVADPVEQQRLAGVHDEVNKYIMEQDKSVRDNLSNQAHRLVQTANSNGMYIEDNLTGYRIRNLESQEILFEGHTPSEGIDFVNQSGQATALDVDANNPVPTELFKTNAPAPALGDPGIRQQLDDIISASRGGVLDKIRSKFQAFDASVPWLSSMRAFVTAADEAHSTNFFKPYTRLQNASILFENTVKDAYKRAQPLMDEIRKTFSDPDRMVLAARYRETLSPSEIESSLFRDRPLSQGEKNIGQFIADKNIDETKVLKYRTQRNQIISQIKAENFNRYGNTDALLKIAKTDEQRAAISASQKAGLAKIAKEFQPAFDKLNGDYKLTPDEQELFTRFEAIAGNGINETGIYGGVRLGRALKNPDIDGLSRKEFAAKYNFTPQEIGAIGKLDKFYEQYANTFGIEESRRINGYLNHQRMIGGDVTDPRDMVKFTAHLENPNAARFMSDMIRTGEVQDYNHDIVEAMRGYIRGGYKARILFPEIYGRDFGERKILGAKDEILNQIQLLPPQTQDAVFTRMNEYVEGLSGRQPIADAVLKEASLNYMKKMGIDLPTRPIQGGGFTSSLLGTMQAALTGGKLYQGFRDITDITSRYTIHYGAARAASFVKATFDRSQLNDLLQRGIIRGVDKNSFANPVESSVYGAAKNAKYKFEEALFKVTMQDKIFLQAQAAAYLESKSFSATILNQVMDKKISLDDAVTKLALRRMEDNVTSEIGRLLETHGSEAAAEFYGRQAARKVVGLFGHGEQPAGWNGKAGRIAGAMGMYPVSMRSFAVDMATRGTPKEIAGAMTRYAISQGALFATGKAFGFDMGRWIMTPASLAFTGSPVTQFLANGATAIQALGQDDNKAKFAYTNFKQIFPSLNDPRSMFLPGSYAAYDIMKGLDMMANGGDARGLGQMVGIPASKDANPLDSGELGAPYMVKQSMKDIQAKNGLSF